jgi:hypothetical protein
MDDRVEVWVEAVLARHMRTLTRSEFLRATRALSVRYVEQRSQLPARSPIDSPGKRAAFAGFFAPLHALTVQAIAATLPHAREPLEEIVDLGCGTGVASAAWALSLPTPPRLVGIDQDAWTLGEAAWNWRTLGLTGRTRRGDIAKRDVPWHPPARTPGLVLGWSANELTAESRQFVLARLVDAASRGSSVLVVEPLARAATPWWHEWTSTLGRIGAVAGEWKLGVPLPASLAALDLEAGFRRETLGARTIWLPRRRTV